MTTGCAASSVLCLLQWQWAFAASRWSTEGRVKSSEKLQLQTSTSMFWFSRDRRLLPDVSIVQVDSPSRGAFPHVGDEGRLFCNSARHLRRHFCKGAHAIVNCRRLSRSPLARGISRALPITVMVSLPSPEGEPRPAHDRPLRLWL